MEIGSLCVIATIVMERFSPFQSLKQAEAGKKHLKHSFLLYSHLPVASRGKQGGEQVWVGKDKPNNQFMVLDSTNLSEL